METSCIPHPPGEPLVLFRAWQVEACEGDHCAAALLNFFEHWHNIKLKTRGQAKSLNNIAEKHGEPRTQSESLLQWHTLEELMTGLLNLYGRNMIQASVKRLDQLGFVSRQQNPNPAYKWDRTTHYLFHPESVISWLRANRGIDRDNTQEPQMAQDSLEINDGPTENKLLTDLKRPIDIHENNRAIPKITTKTTPKILDPNLHDRATSLSPTDEPPPRGRGGVRYEDYPIFGELYDLAVVRPSGSKGNKAEALKRWRTIRRNPETDPQKGEQILRAYAYQKTSRQWREADGQYVPELQVWIGQHRWDGVEIPETFNRHTSTAAPSAHERRDADGILYSEAY